MPPPSENAVLLQTVEAYERLGTTRKVALELEINQSTVVRHLKRAERRGLSAKPIYSGTLHGRAAELRPLPPKGKVRSYLLTCAQNNTRLNEEFWENLIAFKDYLGAELLVSRYMYDKGSYANRLSKPGTRESIENVWYDPRITDFIGDERVILAPGLVWCGEANTLPTAVRPLSGFETYTGRDSAIFPHAKIQVESIPSMKDRATKFNYTTGSITQLNYIQRKAGLKAEFHHTFGAALAEVDAEGNWWVRQINAAPDGSFYDLDRFVSAGTVSEGHQLEAINWGDVHVEVLDPSVREACWGSGGILDRYRPAYQFLHDTLDFRSRNHHERKDPLKLFAKWRDGVENVEAEVERVADFVGDESARDFCKTVLVDSNHDKAMLRWLKETDYRFDPVNAVFYLRTALQVYEALENDETNFHLLEAVLRSKGVPKRVRFLREDESFVICREHGGGIECGMHGHLGPNGQRGSPLGLSKMGRKANIGHTHSAGIIDGLYVAGTCSLLDLGYNSGPSSWSHTMIFTYHNGKRTLVTLWEGKERA